jgi:hypothetical protein
MVPKDVIKSNGKDQEISADPERRIFDLFLLSHFLLAIVNMARLTGSRILKRQASLAHHCA